MKKINKSIKLVALLIACLAIPSLAGAQVVNNMYFNIDWDINSPFGNDFADKTSGWGCLLYTSDAADEFLEWRCGGARGD